MQSVRREGGGGEEGVREVAPEVGPGLVDLPSQHLPLGPGGGCTHNQLRHSQLHTNISL